ncbi:MAG: substrate-binding domain-containing protein [Betaproteobacteria bacterium]|nr:substrate-binding domain-containing protein [Betaproteobacteria bacterium]
MKNSIRIVAAGFAALVYLTQAGVPDAAEIKVFSGFGIQKVMEDLGPKFERATGYKLAMTFDNGPPFVKRVRDGEIVDVIVGSQERIVDPLVKDGKIVADSVTVLANTGVSVAVRKGAPKPDVSSPEALKRTLLAAKSISYVPAGGSGAHFAKVLDRLGVCRT